MTDVICNKAEEHECTIDTCYHSVPHKRHAECHRKCTIYDDDDIGCIEVK